MAVETKGVFGPHTKSFLKELSRRIRSSTKEEKVYFYLSQRVSVAVQKGNSVSIMDMTMDDLLE